MTMINAAMTPMQEVEIFGYPALFTPHRVSRDTVHMLFCYEICAPLDRPDQPFSLMEHVQDREFCGTVLTLLPIELLDGSRPLSPGSCVGPEDASWYNPAAFESKYMEPQPDSAERFGKALYEE